MNKEQLYENDGYQSHWKSIVVVAGGGQVIPVHYTADSRSLFDGPNTSSQRQYLDDDEMVRKERVLGTNV